MEPIDIFVYIFYSFGMIEHFESKMFPFSHTHIHSKYNYRKKKQRFSWTKRKRKSCLGIVVVGIFCNKFTVQTWRSFKATKYFIQLHMCIVQNSKIKQFDGTMHNRLCLQQYLHFCFFSIFSCKWTMCLHSTQINRT